MELAEYEAKASDYHRRHPGDITVGVETMNESKIKEVIKRRGRPCKDIKVNEQRTGKHRAHHGATERSSAILRNALTIKWLDFLNNPDNANKTLNQIRADFTEEILR
jgi:hypothetical protein